MDTTKAPIYKRDDGRWAGVIAVNGKRKFIYGKTKQEAQRKMKPPCAIFKLAFLSPQNGRLLSSFFAAGLT